MGAAIDEETETVSDSHSAGKPSAAPKSKLTTISELGIVGFLCVMGYQAVAKRGDEDGKMIRESNAQHQKFVQDTVKETTEVLTGVKGSVDENKTASKEAAAAIVTAVKDMQTDVVAGLSQLSQETDDVGDALRVQGQGIERQAVAFEAVMQKFDDAATVEEQPQQP